MIALNLRRVRLAAAMAIAGVGVYLLARIVKELVKRGRSEALIGNIEARETFAAGSLGFPSGHVAVAAALTVMVRRFSRSSTSATFSTLIKLPSQMPGGLGPPTGWVSVIY